MSFHNGMSTDRELARIWYADALEQAAQDRADKQRHTTPPSVAARHILLAASVVGLAVGLALVVWLVVAL